MPQEALTQKDWTNLINNEAALKKACQKELEKRFKQKGITVFEVTPSRENPSVEVSYNRGGAKHTMVNFKVAA